MCSYLKFNMMNLLGAQAIKHFYCLGIFVSRAPWVDLILRCHERNKNDKINLAKVLCFSCKKDNAWGSFHDSRTYFIPFTHLVYFPRNISKLLKRRKLLHLLFSYMNDFGDNFLPHGVGLIDFLKYRLHLIKPILYQYKL